MVAGPPPTQVSMTTPGLTRAEAPLDCTREKFAPIVDTVFASIFAFGATAAIPGGAVLLATEDDEYNRMFGGILIGAGLVYAALALPFVYSARSGYRDVTACRAAHASRDFVGMP